MPEDGPAKGTPERSPQPRHAGGRRYIEELVSELKKVTPGFLDDPDAFPPGLNLKLAPAQFRSIVRIAEGFLEIEWAQVPSPLIDDVRHSLTRLLETVRAIHSFPGGADDPRAAAEDLNDEMNSLSVFFSEEVEPLLDEARREASRPGAEKEAAAQVVEAAQVREALSSAQAELANLRARNTKISAELDARSALVEAQRDESGAGGATDLAKAYAEQAERHTRQGWYWGGGLVGALVLAVGFGLFLLLEINELPPDAKPGQIASHLALDVLVIGLLIYTVRIASHQFSVHRHLAAVADSKAAALLTFSRIVAGASEPEIRTAMAGILAQSVFSSDHTGFISSAHDQITLVERLAGTVSQRASASAQ
ncbi:MAG TPA: hypothetical protein VEQ41_03585 [Solirubrobacterales bacterium]|nr:hypothetical protein [Solirubrobacterales bacterium]